MRLLERGTVEVAPLAFMRGRTLNRSFIILDEAQNTSPEQMKMFLTRIGFGSKAVVTGDVTQIDVDGGRSGLIGLETHPRRASTGLAFVRLTSRDVVRHKIVQDIVDAYERHTPDDATCPPARSPWHRGASRSASTVATSADEQDAVAVDVDRYARLVAARARAEGVRGPGEVTLMFVDRDAIGELNATHMGSTGATDVLSFPIDGDDALRRRPADEHPMVGDVVVCPAVAPRSGPRARRHTRRRAGAAGRARHAAPAAATITPTTATAAACGPRERELLDDLYGPLDPRPVADRDARRHLRHRSTCWLVVVVIVVLILVSGSWPSPRRRSRAVPRRRPSRWSTRGWPGAERLRSWSAQPRARPQLRVPGVARGADGAGAAHRRGGGAGVRRAGAWPSPPSSTSSWCSWSPRRPRRRGRCSTPSAPRCPVGADRRRSWRDFGPPAGGPTPHRPHQRDPAGQGPEAGPVRHRGGGARRRRRGGRGRR